MVFRTLTVVVAVAVAVGFTGSSMAQETVAPAAGDSPDSPASTSSPSAPPAKTQSPDQKKTSSPSKSAQKPTSEKATFGAGCFWHVEDVFERLAGVNWAVSGYAGGDVPYPSYEMVHEGTTGHAEVVMVDFNPDVISYEELLKVFWKNHDPTSINRQGPDEGPQYRSVIFYHTEEQRRAALKSYRALTDLHVYRSPIVTQLLPMRAFYRAEDYHQDYYGGKPRANSRRKKTTGRKAKKAPAKAAQSATPAKEADADPKGPPQNPTP